MWRYTIHYSVNSIYCVEDKQMLNREKKVSKQCVYRADMIAKSRAIPIRLLRLLKYKTVFIIRYPKSSVYVITIKYILKPV